MEKRIEITEKVSVHPRELRFRTSRSGGPGGQNVNKVETRVELRFDVAHSPSLDETERAIVQERLRGRIDGDGVLRIVCQDTRSQSENKARAIEKFIEGLRKALQPRRKRVPVRPTRASVQRRLEKKKMKKKKKQSRGKIAIDNS